MKTRSAPVRIQDAETCEMARELSAHTGQPVEQAVKDAIRDKLRRVKHTMPDPVLFERIREIQERIAALPVLDNRSDDEIIGYDEHGLPS